MINIIEFKTVRNCFVFGKAANQVTIKIECDDAGLNELNERVYGIESPSRSMVEVAREYVLSDMKGMINAIYGSKVPMVNRILVSGICTIVFWLDGTKTIVRCKADTEFNVYSAFTAALAQKIYGSNSQVNKVIKRKMQIQKKGVKKGCLKSSTGK